MKIFYKTLPIFLFMFSAIYGTYGQTKQTRPDQVALMKKFLGTWKSELGRDTFVVAENKPFGTGMVSEGRIVSHGVTLDSIKQLYGYDKKNDRFIMAELVKSSSSIEINYIRFLTENTGELVVTNTENARFEWKFEFKDPDTIMQSVWLDGRMVRQVSIRRVKSDRGKNNSE